MLIETIAGPFSSALLVNHAALPFDIVTPFATEPLQTVASQSDNDGLVTFAADGGFVPNRVLLVPYALGVKGDQFSVRLWGLRRLGNDRNVERAVWLNTILGEYLCTVCNQPGPNVQTVSYNSQRFLQPTENLCDTISLTHGDLGLTGRVVSPGSDVTPGPDLTAWVLQDLYGSEKLYFDFQPENGFTGTMNCAWARA